MGARIPIKPLEQEAKTTSGLYISETAKEKPQTGRVVAVENSLSTQKVLTSNSW